ncbi:alpha/beta fold hydrolase [Algoriphagus terrigena]|uniref:alpha/beta fold hydrolase n=1 Tax=Algoriphagus terrigena TaxID=344884 RepID=UPI000A03F0F2|nr:alpha/beta hydrolase [Algoriphagus terrigena]
MKSIRKCIHVLILLGLVLTPFITQSSFAAENNWPLGDTTAVNSKTKYLKAEGHMIAYRSIGKGTPIILCNRYRGNLDSWDPAFLDALATRYQVIIFDYSGFGLSTGVAPSDMETFAGDVKSIATALGFEKFVLGGWSFGGMVAQVFIAENPELVSRGILIGTGPPGQNNTPMEPVFFERSSILHNSLDDETVLFFEPAWEASREAAKRSHDRIAKRTHDLDVLIPESLWGNYHKAYGGYVQDADGIREKILTSKVPMLVVMGDHDISFPLQNWYALARKLQSAQLIVLPMAGHGPQQEFPELVADYIDSFLTDVR